MTMDNIETWVRQLNGELDVSKIAQTTISRKPNDYVKEYRVYLTSEQKCSLTLTNGMHSPKRIIPNLRLIFNEVTNRLIRAEVLSGG